MAVGSKEECRKLHAVIVPFPAQGHINPMLQLARQLVRVHGFRVTFVNTTQNLHDRCIKSSRTATTRWDSGIKFVVLSDAPATFQMSNSVELEQFLEALTNMGPKFETQFEELLAEAPITCLIRDYIMSCVHKSARKYGIPVAALATMSAVATHCCFHHQTFITQGLLPLPAPPADENENGSQGSSSNCSSYTWLDQMKTSPRPPRSAAEAAGLKRIVGHVLAGLSPNLTVAELPSSFLIHSEVPSIFQTMRSVNRELIPDCDCLLLNTFHELETTAIHGMDENPVILPLGPLVFLNREVPATHSPTGLQQEKEPLLGDALCPLREEDPTTLHWLDSQQPASVIYVSFGSLATVPVAQLLEIAHGLEASEQPFLWVIREDLVDGEQGDFSTFLAGFREATKDRSYIAPWVPQTAVLSHSAVGAFLTHCGWNSTLESISAGVPLLALPVFAEQGVNAFYVTQVWGNGVRLERDEQAEVVTRQAVESQVRSVLAADAGVKTRARELQLAARKAVLPGGSSQRAMAEFVERIVACSRESALAHDMKSAEIM